MNQQEIADLSADLVIRYYDNDVAPFLNHMDDDALWYGPAQGQILRGREQMIHTWSQEDHQLTFTMGNLKVVHVSGNLATSNVMLTYTVVTHYPDGLDLSVFQRTQLCWCMRTLKDDTGMRVKVPRILMCHISNPHPKSDEDTIYAKNPDQIYRGTRAMPYKSERIHLHGADGSDYFFLSDSIHWAEAVKRGKHCVVHTPDGTVELRTTISELERQFGHLFLRCHTSYLLNPHYVRAIRRFKVTMADGTELPIPEKRYTSFRASVVERMDG